MSVQEHYVSGARMAANAAWVLTGMLMLSGWVVAIVRPESARPVAAMLAFSAVVTAIIAATVQIRIYMVRVCAQIRRMAPSGGAKVHAMR